MKIRQFLIIILTLNTFNLSAQYYNLIYNHNEVPEFQSEIHLLENSNLIEVGSIRLDNNSIIIRDIDSAGNLLWSGIVANDSLDLYSALTHSSTVKDSILFMIATSQKFDGVPIFTYPYFLKYNLNQQKLIFLNFYPRKLNHTIQSMVYHTDGYLYAVGFEYLFDGYRNRDVLIMKFNTEGKLIWEKNLDFDETINQASEIESFNDQLVITGQIATDDTKTIIAKLDTTAKVLEKHISTPFASNGTIDVEIYKNEIYFTTTSDIELENYETQYLAKFTDDLQLIWDTLIPNTSRYDINCRRMEILNDEIIMSHNIREADAFTNNKDWSYASSWSLDGEFNWEHVYFYDSTYIHHLDDIETTPEGDLIFMGTVVGRNPTTEATQFLWLFKTDADGCGTVQDTCHYTLDRYFGLDSTLHTIDLDTIVTIIGADTLVSIIKADTTVNIIETMPIEFAPIQILGNPFNEFLHLQSSLLLSKKYQIKIHNIQGELVYEQNLSYQNKIATQHWAKGMYFLELMVNGRLLWSEKLVKQ